MAAAMFAPLGFVTPAMKARLRQSFLYPVFAAIYSWVGRRLGPGLYEIKGGPAKGMRIWAEPSLRRGYLAGLYEPAVTRAISENCGPGMTVFDVGAHAGYFTLVMARAGGPGGQCIAFEPDAGNALGLRATLAANQLECVSLEEAVVGHESGTVGFRTHDLSTMGRMDGLIRDADLDVFGHLVDVPSVSIDSYATQANLQRLDFIKIDVEGAERQVIEGAAAVLQRLRPTLLVEVHDFEAPTLHAQPFVADLIGRGYVVNDVETRHSIDPANYAGGTILAVHADRW